MARRDVDAIRKALLSIPIQVRKDIDPAIEKGAEEMAGRMRYLAPDDPKTNGTDLKGSIKKTRGDVPLAIRVSAIDIGPDGFDNALAQEYGTADMPASPFFWPSVNTTKKRVKSRIDRAISKAIDKAWRK
ncbi:HK97-gp10 family putative phage morphogenesis protein [Phyllobacterium sp. SB3]|uniref:HK97-gp10 family putative phage morphogenesis protein n=1 Tax=Phyllobacterium sp. SB3 TaxID=3156073 RepID=UPI0032AF2AB0